MADPQQSLSWLYVSLGDKERAFAALDRARVARDPSMSWIRNTGILRPLQADPRWAVLLHQIGLAEEQLR